MIVERDGLVLVGTAHVSNASVEEVREAIRTHKPNVVAVELDEPRFKAVTEKARWENTRITDLLKGGKMTLLLAQSLLASYQRKMGEKYGVSPGAEMVAAIDEAKASGATLTLADRDISITLKRAWARMGFFEKWRLAWEFMKSVMGLSDEEEMDVDELLQEDVLTLMMSELAEVAPSIAEVLIFERDAYLAKSIIDAREAAGPDGKVLAVVGAGHMAGIEKYLDAPETIPAHDTLIHVPEKKFKWGTIIGYGLVAIIVGLLGYALWTGYTQHGVWGLARALGIYIGITGTLAAIFVAIVRAHPYSIISAFLAAPVAIIHPLIATGWVAGYVEAKIHSPTVKDFEQFSQMKTFGDMWRNRVMRILLVAAFGNIGAMIGAWIVAGYFLVNL